MNYSQDLVEIMRADIGAQSGLAETERHEALCFLLDGKLLCGVSGDSAFYHTGRINEGEALQVASNFFVLNGEGSGGLVELDPSGFLDPTRRQILTGLSLNHVATLTSPEGES